MKVSFQNTLSLPSVVFGENNCPKILSYLIFQCILIVLFLLISIINVNFFLNFILIILFEILCYHFMQFENLLIFFYYLKNSSCQIYHSYMHMIVNSSIDIVTSFLKVINHLNYINFIIVY